MNTVIRDWCQLAWSQVAALPGGIGSDSRARWDVYARREDVVVTFFGPYDAGKSSLLKRLLVEDNQPVPDWLTVSGRRESFECSEVKVMGVVVRDTPGIAGGNELHEQAAKDALVLSDLIVLFLPPQLVTSKKEYIVAVMNGNWFNCPAKIAYAPHGLGIILSRMEEAGNNPRDDLTGYRALVKRKLDELGNLLQAENVPEDIVAIYPVSADPFALVANRMPVGKADYAADLTWDGVAAVADFLRGLTARKAELRLHSEVRFLGVELSTVAELLEKMDADSQIAVKAAVNEAKSHELARERLKSLLGAARADLDRRIEEEVSSAGRRGAADVKELHDAILSRIEPALEQWAKRHDSELEALLREANAEMKVRRDRPAWKKLSEVLNGESFDDKTMSAGSGTRETVGKINQLTKLMHKGYREALPFTIGMSLEEARKELKLFQKAASFEEYAKQASKGTVAFRDAAHATQARRAVLLDVGFDAALPAILELGGLVAEAWSDHKVTEERATRRKEARRIIEESSKKLAERAWSLWCDDGMPAAVGAALLQAQRASEKAEAALKTESKNTEESLASLKTCLAQLQEMKKNSQI